MQNAFLPARFAAYIALSACAISVAASPASSGKMETPRLAETRAFAPPKSSYGRSTSAASLLTALDRRCVLHLLEHHEELVAADARHHIARAQAAAQAPRHFLQERVARGVAVQVVDLLEAVQVHEDPGELGAVPARALDRLL